MEKKDLLSLAIFVCFLIIFFYPVIVQQKTFITTGLIQSDLMNQNYPLKAAFGEALKKGEFLLWSPLIGNGFPVFAEGQIGGLYPINLLLFRFLPKLTAFNFSLLIHYFLAGFFTYQFGRKILKLSPVSGLLAGITYSFSGFFMTHLVHPSMIQVASFIPLNFLLIEKIINKGQKKQQGFPLFVIRYSLFLAIVFALQALAGHHELLYFSSVFLGFYLFFRTMISSGRQFLRQFLTLGSCFLTAGLIGIGLSAAQILPTLEMVEHSTRSGGLLLEQATGYLYPPSHFLTFISPRAFKFSQTVDYTSRFPDAINLWETYGYVGIIPLVLALGVVTALFKRLATPSPAKAQKGGSWFLTPFIVTFTILLVFSVLLALGRATPVFNILWRFLPGVRLFKYPTRFLVFTEFSMAILAAVGFESLGFRLRKFLSRKLTFYTLNSILYTLVLLVFLDLFIHNRPINPTTDPAIWFNPPETAKFLGQNLGNFRFHTLGTNQFDYILIDDVEAQIDLKNFLPADFNMLFGLYSNEFQAGLLLKRSAKLARQAPETRLTYVADKNSLAAPSGWIRLLSLQAVKFIISPLPLYHPSLSLAKTVPLKKPLTFNIYVLREEGQKLIKILTQKAFIYRNQDVLPRAFLVPKAYSPSETDESELLKLLSDPGLDFSQTVLLEEKVRWAAKDQIRGRAEITKERDQYLRLNVSSNLPAFLFLSDTYYPGWKAFVDGRETPIFRANYAFRAVPIPRGDHKVEFFYQPESFKKGRAISLATGILTASLLILSLGRFKIGRAPKLLSFL